MSDPVRSCGLDARKARVLDLRMMGWAWQKIADTLTAEGAPVSHETVRRWSLSDEYQAEYAQRRAEIDRATQGAQVGLVEMAYETIRGVMSDPDASDDARLRAAEDVLRYLGPAVRSEVAITGTVDEIRQEMARLRAARGDP